MPKVHLRVVPEFLAPTPISVGTIDHIRVIQRSLGISLREAKAYVDRCVFDGETVVLSVSSYATAEALVRDLQALGGPARVDARLELEA